ncbi:MAG: hypothetical protein ACHP85_24885, partial [Burkholderiales bacterium]
MKRMLAMMALAGLAACSRRPGPGEAPAKAGERPAASEHAEGEGPEGSETEIRIAKEMLRDLRITTAVVESRPGGEGASVLGELHVDEDRYAEVASPIAAQAVRLRAAPGDVVVAGQTLVELASLAVGKARGDHRAAEARRALAAPALARKRGRLGREGASGFRRAVVPARLADLEARELDERLAGRDDVARRGAQAHCLRRDRARDLRVA